MKDFKKIPEKVVLQGVAQRRSAPPVDLHAPGGIIEKRFRSLIENSFDVIKIIDSSGGVQYISPSVEHVLGYRPSEVIGRSSFEYLHPDDHDKAREIFQRIVERRGVHYAELRIVHKDGSTRIVECVAQNLIDDPAIKGIVLNYRDITARKASDEALRHSEEKFSKAFHASPDSITLTEIADGRFIDVNEGFEQITGYRRSEIIGKTSLELGIWEDISQRPRMVRQLLEDGSIRNFELRIRTKAGDIRTCLISADVIQLNTGPCVLAVTRDITEARDAEVLLWEIAERLKLEREQSSEKDIALRQVLAHIENEKASCRSELVMSVEKLIRPVIAALRKKGRLARAEVDRFEKDFDGIARNVERAQGGATNLTRREADICECIKEGLSSKEIAEKLGLSPQTVHKHRQVIRRKLQLSNTSVNLSAFLRSRALSDAEPTTRSKE